MHQLDLVMDFQYGSTGKGLIAGYLAKREKYDTVVCSFATNAGHTYRDGALTVMTQQLPTGIISPTVKNVLLGPGALIHVDTFFEEMGRYQKFLAGKRVMIHPQAAIVHDAHAAIERSNGMTKMGSTAKGVGEAMIQRIRRDPNYPNVAGKDLRLSRFVATEDEYRDALSQSEACLVEGAQGFSLSMYHGFYPYTTSRDVTPWQILADCGIPFRWAGSAAVIGCLRTFPIRVNNRDGSSGPGYEDQLEIDWKQIGVEPELTTVTKLPRRLFTFSQQQFQQAMWHCAGYWRTRIFLNFANYLQDPLLLQDLINCIEMPTRLSMNHAHVEWIGFGPDDSDVCPRLVHERTSGIDLVDMT